MSSNVEKRSNLMVNVRDNLMVNVRDEEEEETCISAIELLSSAVLPMVLKAAVELDLLELIKKSEPEAISASELAALLPTNNPEAASMIDKILRLIAAHSILTCTTTASLERRYSLTPMCRFLTRNEDGVSLAPCLLLMNQDRVFMETWYHLKDTVIEGGTPFNRAHGMTAFEYPTTDARFNKVFNRAMFEQSTLFMKRILEKYNGFEEIKSLVDVGGGIGASLKMILSKYPSIRGINFDLPHVIEHALSYPGMEHISGDMFVSVPKADIILLKWICHDWSDEHCKKLLKNCYDALPENGKLIVADAIYPDDTNTKNQSAIKGAAQANMVMMMYNVGGKERTEKEFQTLAEYAGFKEVVKVCCAFHIWIMEFHK